MASQGLGSGNKLNEPLEHLRVTDSNSILVSTEATFEDSVAGYMKLQIRNR